MKAREKRTRKKKRAEVLFETWPISWDRHNHDHRQMTVVTRPLDHCYSQKVRVRLTRPLWSRTTKNQGVSTGPLVHSRLAKQPQPDSRGRTVTKQSWPYRATIRFGSVLTDKVSRPQYCSRSQPQLFLLSFLSLLTLVSNQKRISVVISDQIRVQAKKKAKEVLLHTEKIQYILKCGVV